MLTARVAVTPAGSRKAIDDDVADSPWDNVKDWYDANAGWIKSVTKVLSYVAAALAVVALFIPGLNVAVFLLTAGVLLSQGILAASGNGSWADVGLSVFALATMGVGRLATVGLRGAGGLRGVQAATRAAGSRAARRVATSNAMRSSRAARTAAGKTLSRRTASAAQRRGARRTIDSAKTDAQQAGTRAAREVRDAPLARATYAERARAGGPDAAQYHNDIAHLRARFPGDAGVQQASRNADLLRSTNAGATHTGIGVDAADKYGEDVGIEPYKEAKGHYKQEVGSTW